MSDYYIATTHGGLQPKYYVARGNGTPLELTPHQTIKGYYSRAKAEAALRRLAKASEYTPEAEMGMNTPRPEAPELIIAEAKRLADSAKANPGSASGFWRELLAMRTTVRLVYGATSDVHIAVDGALQDVAIVLNSSR